MSETNIIEKGCRESEQNEQDTEADNTPEKKTRVRLKSPRLQLQVTLQRMEKLAQHTDLKTAKAADLLMSMAELQKMLLQLSLDEEKEKIEAEHAALSAQHEQDAARIAALEAQNSAFKNHRCETTVITRTDPEVAAIREQNTALCDILKQMISPLDQDARARLAIQVIMGKPEHVARMFLPTLQVDYAKYRRLLNEYSTEQQLFDVIDRAGDYSMGDLVVFCRACLGVVHGVNISSKRREKKEFDPAVFGTLETRIAEVRARRERLEAQRTSPAIDSGTF